MRSRISIALALLLVLHGTYVTAQEQVTVSVPEGEFVFRNLQFVPDRISSRDVSNVRGEVVNNTSKDWNWVRFALSLYGPDGGRIRNRQGESSFPETVTGLKKGASKTLGLDSNSI